MKIEKEIIKLTRLHQEIDACKHSGFAAYLLLDVSDGRANFSLEFPKKKGKKA